MGMVGLVGLVEDDEEVGLVEDDKDDDDEEAWLRPGADDNNSCSNPAKRVNTNDDPLLFLGVGTSSYPMSGISVS